MTKNFRRKKILSSICIALCILLAVGFMPATAHAGGYGDKGYDTTLDASYKIDGNDVFVYVTGTGGDITRISGGDDDSVQQYQATASENWEFAYWSTCYYGPTLVSTNPKAALGYYYFSRPGDNNNAYDETNPVIQVNEEMWAAGVFYLQAIFKPKITVSANIVPDNCYFIISASSPEPVPDDINRSDAAYVPFGGNVTTSLCGHNLLTNYMVESVTVHDGAPRNDFTLETQTNAAGDSMMVKFAATRPTNVQINIRLKEQIIAFDANTGSGSMESQSFDRGVEETLFANTFTKPGYVFDGWNTVADGTGTAYTDKQSVAFTPANDGDTITLYAQWTECTSHNWEGGMCTYCKEVCSHNYVYSGSDNVVTETCTAGCSHNETATIKQDDSIPTVYNGSYIEALKVVYSDEWKGGTLDISYTDNVKAGLAKGTITKDNATATGTFEISKAPAPTISIPAVSEVTYGKKLSDITFEDTVWRWADGNAIPTVINSGYTAFYTPADIDNYDWSAIEGWNNTLKKVVRTVPVTVTPKELTITWGNTEFTYDGTEKFPETIVSGIITGDEIQLVRSGAETNANAEGESYTATITGIVGPDAANYKLPNDVSTEFTILKAPQSAPDNTDNTVNTGDNNIIWLWLILILISSGIAITIVSINRRR